MIVDDHLRVDNRLYVIGDNAVTPYSGLGLTAVHNANYVARDIVARIEGAKITPAYHSLVPATVVPVGKSWAVFQYRSLVIGGLIGGVLRSLADLVSYNDITGWQSAFNLWAHSGDLEEHCVLCKTALSEAPALFNAAREQY